MSNINLIKSRDMDNQKSANNDITSVHSNSETRNWAHQPQDFIAIWFSILHL